MRWASHGGEREALAVCAEEDVVSGVFRSSRPGENQRMDNGGAIAAVGAVSGDNGLSGKRAR